MIERLLDAIDFYSPWEPVWEPCAGDGRMVEAMERRGYKVISSDITSGQDFFEVELAQSRILVTNPPFGMIRPFIDHAFKIGVTQMALVCPERLWACKKGFDQFNRHRPSRFVNLDWREDYLGRGKGHSPDRALALSIWNTPHNNRCEFEVWDKNASTNTEDKTLRGNSSKDPDQSVTESFARSYI